MFRDSPRGALTDALAAGGGEAKRVFEAMPMNKIDMAAIEAAGEVEIVLALIIKCRCAGACITFQDSLMKDLPEEDFGEVYIWLHPTHST